MIAGAVDAVKRVRELYPPSSEMRVKMENDRRVFLNAMAQIKQETILGVDKNTYVEPIILDRRMGSTLLQISRYESELILPI